MTERKCTRSNSNRKREILLDCLCKQKVPLSILFILMKMEWWMVKLSEILRAGGRGRGKRMRGGGKVCKCMHVPICVCALGMDTAKTDNHYSFTSYKCIKLYHWSHSQIRFKIFFFLYIFNVRKIVMVYVSKVLLLTPSPTNYRNFYIYTHTSTEYLWVHIKTKQQQ